MFIIGLTGLLNIQMQHIDFGTMLHKTNNNKLYGIYVMVETFIIFKKYYSFKH